MVIDWSVFAPALLLLLIPMGLFHGKRVRYRPISRNWPEQLPQIVLLPHHFVDLLRAGLGAWLLSHSLEPALAPATALEKYLPAIVQGAVICAGVLLQTLFCKEPDSLNAPYAYVVGIVAGFLPPVVAGFALLFASVVTIGLRSAAAFFLMLSISTVAAGFLFTGQKFIFSILALCVAVLVPWLLALLFAQELVLTHRQRRNSENEAALRDSPVR